MWSQESIKEKMLLPILFTPDKGYLKCNEQGTAIFARHIYSTAVERAGDSCSLSSRIFCFQQGFYLTDFPNESRKNKHKGY